MTFSALCGGPASDNIRVASGIKSASASQLILHQFIPTNLFLIPRFIKTPRLLIFSNMVDFPLLVSFFSACHHGNCRTSRSVISQPSFSRYSSASQGTKEKIRVFFCDCTNLDVMISIVQYQSALARRIHSRSVPSSGVCFACVLLPWPIKDIRILARLLME